MTDSSISMKGGGYYSKNTPGAKHVIDRAGAHVMEKLSQMEITQSDRPFSVIDYGAADGGTSLDMITKIVKNVRGRAKTKEINVTYTDLPHNDFSVLFRLMHNQIPGTKSYLSQYSNVFVLCAGTSFYEQIVPRNSIDIGFSATAMHWLSGMPGKITDHVHAVGAHGAEWEIFRDYAQADWEKILLNRARELAPGGVLVMANFCIDEQGRYFGNTGGANMFDTFNNLWRELAESGVITQQEYQVTTFPQFYKTIDLFRAPFENPAGAVSRAGLQLETFYTGMTECPYRARFNEDGDSIAFADAYVPTLRSWSETVFMGSLNSSRPMAQRREIVDDFYGRYNALVRREPERHGLDYVHTYMVVVKNS